MLRRFFALSLLSLVAVPSLALAADTGAPPPAAPFVVGAIHWPGEKAQFFYSDGTYVRYDVKADKADVGYPQDITDKTWPGLGDYANRIIAAFDGANGKAYIVLTKGEYIRYDVKADHVDNGYPKRIDDGTWPGVGDYATSIVAVTNWPGNKLQIFLDDGRYIRYDNAADRADKGYPQPINDKTWPGVAPYAKHLAGMIEWENGKVYMFLDTGEYLRYDVAADRLDDGYPKVVSKANWPGLAR
jgi:hypothetical protein